MKTPPAPRSAYQVYNADAKRRQMLNKLEQMYPALPDDRFDVVYADPPWDYGGKMQFDKSAIKSENPGFRRDVFISAATFKYPTLKTAELKLLDVASICNDDALLFMWVTSPHLANAIELGQAWGFDYKTVAFVWNKMVHNPGKYTMSYCELCLVFKRGRIPSPRGARNIKQLVEVPRGDHSEKPAIVRDNIRAMFPSQKKIELFARHSEIDWTSWGLDEFNPRLAIRAGGVRDTLQNEPLVQLDLLSSAT